MGWQDAPEVNSAKAPSWQSAPVVERKAKPKPAPQPSMGERLMTSAKGVLGSVAEGVESTLMMPYEAAKQVNRGVTMGIAAVGEPVARGLGFTGVANALMREGDNAQSGRGAFATRPSLSSQALPETNTSPSRLAGNFLGAALVPLPSTKAPNRVQAPRPTPKPTANPAREIVQAGEQNGVRVMTSDLKAPKTAIGRSAQKLGEMIPLAGTAGNRAAQQAERKAAVEGFAREFGAADGVIDDVTKSLVATRSNQISNLTKAKRTVIEGLDGAPVPMSNAMAKIDATIAEMTGRNTPASQAVAQQLQQIKTDLTGKTLPQIEAYRADELSSIFKRNDMAHIKDVGEKALRPVYTALNEDMGAFIKQAGGPEAFLKWKGANTKLSMLAGELKGNQLAGVLKTADATPENVSRILFSSKPSEVRRLYSNLSAAGRTKAQSAIVYRAVEKAGGFKELSPDKFLNAMEDLSKSSGVFFQGGDKVRLEGLTRLLDATRRAGQAGVLPNNGSQVVPYAIPAVLTQIFGLQGGVTVAGSAGLLARIYESAPVRDALLKLGRSKPGTKAEAIYLERIGVAMTAALEGQAGRLGALNDNVGVSAAAGDGQENQGEQQPALNP